MLCLYKEISIKLYTNIKVILRIVVCDLHSMSEDIQFTWTCS